MGVAVPAVSVSLVMAMVVVLVRVGGRMLVVGVVVMRRLEPVRVRRADTRGRRVLRSDVPVPMAGYRPLLPSALCAGGAFVLGDLCRDHRASWAAMRMCSTW